MLASTNGQCRTTVGAATVRVECKNSAATSFGVSATSESFNIRKAGLELLSPQGHHRVTANGSTVVSWKRGAGVADAVNVLYRASSGPRLHHARKQRHRQCSLSYSASYAFP